MAEYPIALFDSFSDVPSGGSVAALVADAADLNADQMQQIAKEFGAPATGFVTGVDGEGVDVRFFSTSTEYSMCGHGTVALITWLVERNVIGPMPGETLSVGLRTPTSTASVRVRRRPDGRPEVMLILEPATFEASVLAPRRVAAMLGTEPGFLHPFLPIEVSASDFTHLVAPVRDLAAIEGLVPDCDAIADLREELGIDTVAVFTEDAEHPQSTIRCRDFCPGVGTDEAPATGTTNRALACYLLRHDVISTPVDGELTVVSEQGYEMGRPSEVRTELTFADGELVEVKVGGVATRTVLGTIDVG